MKVYDAEKTKELLKFLSEEETSVEDLSSILCKKIVGIRLKAARGQMGVSVNLKSLGISIDSKDKDIEEFMKENMSAGSFSFFNKKDIKKIDSLIGITRQALYRYSIANDGSTYYLTEDNYKEFKKDFHEKYLEKFNELKNDLILNLDVSKKSFENKLSKWLALRKLDEDEATLTLKKYLSKFPIKEQIERQFKMYYYTIAFPVFNETNIDGIDSDISKDLLEDKDNTTIETFYNMIANCLVSLFEITSKVIESINVSTIAEEEMPLDLNLASRTKGMLNKTINDLINNNKVLKNEKIGKIVNLLSKTFIDKKSENDERITNGEASEIGETLLASIYSYAKYINVEESLETVISKSEYSIEDLDLMSEIIDLDNL